ncbi:alpha/beta fold hydrolase [Methylophilus flavus]|uniref:Alpha/beta fold hydrolase n=1 Tax=Methylophilus flavus TaxID=640084 RepID=A0ABW3PBJ6_9PROT
MNDAPKDLKFNGEEHFIKLTNGETIRVIKTGQGAPLLLMHTIRTQIEFFSEVIPFYAENYTVYAVDLPGHGLSSIHKAMNYDEPYLRNALIEVINQLGLDNLTLVGESIGATLALTIAATLPEKIKQVFAVNTYDYETRYADGIRRGNLIANFMLWNYSIPVHGAIFAALENRFFLSLVMNGGVTNIRKIPGWLMKLFDQTGHRPGYTYLGRNILKNWRSWSKSHEFYRQVKCPVILVYGEFDWSTQQERSRTLNQLPTATLQTIAGAGHFLSLDNPEALKLVFKKTVPS